MRRTSPILGLFGLVLLAGCDDTVDANVSSSTVTTGAVGSSSGSGASTTSSGAGGAGSSASASTSTSTSTSTTGATTGAGTGGGAPLGCGLPIPTSDSEYTLPFGGADRTFRVHVPPGLDASTPAPLVMVFHGYLEDGDQIETITKMTPAADARGYVVVYADGLGKSWNAGGCCGSSASNGVDDVGFVGAMIDFVEAHHCIDPKRVYAAGFSNGGMLSHRLACEMSERIAAIGPVSGTMAIDACAPSRPVPVMHFHGTSDFVVAYANGGLSGAKGVDETMAGWVMRDACTASPHVVFQQGSATCESWSPCAAGADVVRCKLQGGGHQWPGGNSAGPGGTINMDIAASEAMLDFFTEHPLP
ncbi:MAG: PHB depolymerase family esterase [Polyangiaceae bacterium]